ncbi:MAG: hypothetical protein IH853_13750 [Bacteroidetes bacterium]|nr:hypothetical protein [Bacteroidota bacterium]
MLIIYELLYSCLLMNELFDLADGGIRQLFEMQRAVLTEAGAPIPSQAST